MKADDPRLEQAHKTVIEQVNNLNEFIVIVLKYHVHTESMMVALIEANGKTAENAFAQKIRQCEIINPPEIDAATWKVLRKANRLRNAVAHKIDGTEVKDAIMETRTAYAALSEQAADDEKHMSDTQLAMSALAHCSSFIVVATENNKEASKKKA